MAKKPLEYTIDLSPAKSIDYLKEYLTKDNREVMNTSLTNFNRLSNSIRQRAIQDIEQYRPDNQLVKWQKLLTAIHETELAVHRVRSSLNLLKTLPTIKALHTFSMSAGAWIDYQYATWSLLMYSLIDKEIELVSQVGQKLIKPNNPEHKEIVRPLVKSLVSQKDKVGKVRHPITHKGKGGPVEAVMKTDLWKNFVIIPSPVDFNEILASYVPYHMRWYYFLDQVSNAVLSKIEQICGKLNQHIDWDNI